MAGMIVWLASYPKSGNTWLRAVYTSMRTGRDPDINALEGADVAADRGLFERVLGVRSSDMTVQEVEVLRPRADEAMVSEQSGDTWRKIHDGLFNGPTGEPIVSVKATRAALYVIRDPRDVAISMASHAHRTLAWAVERMGRRGASVSSSNSSLSDQLCQRLGSWSEHVLSWVDHSRFPIYVLRYEDCLAAPVPTFRAAFAGAGLQVSAKDVAAAVERSSWQRLRAQEDSVGFKEHVGGSRFFRQGVAGAWRTELPEALARQVETQHREVMARYGYLG